MSRISQEETERTETETEIFVSSVSSCSKIRVISMKNDWKTIFAFENK